MSATTWEILHAQHAHYSRQGHKRHHGHRRNFKRWLTLPFPWAPLPYMALGLGVLVGIPLAVALVTTLAAVAIALAVSAVVAVSIFGVTGFVAWHLARAVAPSLARAKGKRKGRHARAALSTTALPVMESPVDVLRLRYAAGEIGQTEFRTRLTELLKERYVRGELTLPEFESRVHHLYLDPALRPPV